MMRLIFIKFIFYDINLILIIYTFLIGWKIDIKSVTETFLMGTSPSIDLTSLSVSNQCGYYGQW